MVAVFTLTPGAAAQALQDNGLDALGLTGLRLSPTWGMTELNFEPTTLQLTPTTLVQAPFRGTLEYLDSGAEFRDVNGIPIIGPVGALRLHPQAVTRLNRLMASRYAAPGQPHHRPVTETIVFSGLESAPNVSPETYEPGEGIEHLEPMSFHDNRGLIIDPIAVAAIFADLLGAFPALDFSDGDATDGDGGVATVAGIESGVLVQVCDLHGRPFAAVAGGPAIEKRDADDSPGGNPGGSGLVELQANETLAGSGADAATRLRLGWATGGVMDVGPLEQPTLPAGPVLERQFLRAFAVDLDWHLRGNRSTSEVRGVPAEDGDMPEDLKPQVRDGVSVDYPIDGPDVVAHSGQVLERMNGAEGGLVFVVAPQIDADVPLPPAPGSPAHWPGFPPPGGAGGFAPGGPPPLGNATATWTEGNDVVVVIPAGNLPDGASVRIYSQAFQLIESIGEAPSFLRGDGGASIVVAGNDTQVLVSNPLDLQEGDPKPSPATLVFDLVVAPRTGARRLFAKRSLAIADGSADVPPDMYPTLGLPPDWVGGLPPAIKSICPAPLFGLQRTVDPGEGLTNPIDVVRALGHESEPRQGPRHPTMGRLESITATGIVDNDALQEGLMWDAVVSGARWTRETLSAMHRQGNPGNPAGPDTMAAGVRVDGALGYDVARHAVRRVQPLLPLPGGADVETSPGWLVYSGGNNMNPPTPDEASPPPLGSSSGVLLQTVAAIAETPELSLLPPDTPLGSDSPITFQQLIDALVAALNIPPESLSVSVANEDRLINEVRREYFLSTHGARDALWSLARAISEADELVYIESAGFARTARAGGVNDIDLVQILANRLAVQPKLKVIVCTPRETDFAPAPFARQAMVQRKEAFDLLSAAGPGRVVAFHPRGFPGRSVALRTTSVIVDDVWSMTGATHFRRRGMTFDGSAAIASFDRDIVDGYSRKVRRQRHLLMAAKLGLRQTDANGLPVAEFVRLARPAAAFDLIFDLLQQGGLGIIAPLWHGPTDDSVILQSDDVADPDGSDGAPPGLGLAGLLSEA